MPLGVANPGIRGLDGKTPAPIPDAPASLCLAHCIESRAPTSNGDCSTDRLQLWLAGLFTGHCQCTHGELVCSRGRRPAACSAESEHVKRNHRPRCIAATHQRTRSGSLHVAQWDWAILETTAVDAVARVSTANGNDSKCCTTTSRSRSSLSMTATPWLRLPGTIDKPLQTRSAASPQTLA